MAWARTPRRRVSIADLMQIPLQFIADQTVRGDDVVLLTPVDRIVVPLAQLALRFPDDHGPRGHGGHIPLVQMRLEIGVVRTVGARSYWVESALRMRPSVSSLL